MPTELAHLIRNVELSISTFLQVMIAKPLANCEMPIFFYQLLSQFMPTLCTVCCKNAVRVTLVELLDAKNVFCYQELVYGLS